MVLTKNDMMKLSHDEISNLFFKTASKVGLVVDDNYISGIPNGLEEDVELFYTLEDVLDYPKPQKI